MLCTFWALEMTRTVHLVCEHGACQRLRHPDQPQPAPQLYTEGRLSEIEFIQLSPLVLDSAALEGEVLGYVTPRSAGSLWGR